MTLPLVSTRFAYIDAQRGIAALLVIAFHTCEVFIQLPGPPTGDWLFTFFNSVDAGRIGVVMFFATSGFVIPFSLKSVATSSKTHALKVFLIHRFFRLYPAYWLSVLAAGLLGLYVMTPFTASTVLLNLTMLQTVLGAPDMIGLYWTLRVELLFYALCALLFLTGSLRHPQTLALGMIASPCGLFALGLLLQRLQPGDDASSLNYLPVYGVYLAIMFWGALFRIRHDQTSGHPSSPWPLWVRFTFMAFPACVCLAPLLIFLLYSSIPLAYASKILTLATPLALGIGLFILFSTLCRIQSGITTWLGKISYSLYLFHPIVFYALFGLIRDGHLPFLTQAHLGVYLCLTLTGTILLSSLTYYGLEKPAIQLGRRVSAR